MAYATKPKTGSSYEIELMDVATRHVTHLTKNTPKELSNERADLLARRQVHHLHAVARDRQRLQHFLVDLASGAEYEPDAARGAAQLLRCRYLARRQDRAHHLRRAQRLRQCGTAGYRVEEDRLADQRQVGDRSGRLCSRRQIADLDGECRRQHQHLLLRHCSDVAPQRCPSLRA